MAHNGGQDVKARPSITYAAPSDRLREEPPAPVLDMDEHKTNTGNDLRCDNDADEDDGDDDDCELERVQSRCERCEVVVTDHADRDV